MPVLTPQQKQDLPAARFQTQTSMCLHLAGATLPLENMLVICLSPVQDLVRDWLTDWQKLWITYYLELASEVRKQSWGTEPLNLWALQVASVRRSVSARALMWGECRKPPQLSLAFAGSSPLYRQHQALTDLPLSGQMSLHFLKVI